MPPGTPERQAERQRTIAMIQRSADGQASKLVEIAVSSWATRLAPPDLAVVAAASSNLIQLVPPAALRPGDLLVRNADDSFWSYRLVTRPLP